MVDWREDTASGGLTSYRSHARLEAEKSGYSVHEVAAGYTVANQLRVVNLPIYDRPTSAWIAAAAYERGIRYGYTLEKK